MILIDENEEDKREKEEGGRKGGQGRRKGGREGRNEEGKEGYTRLRL